MKNTFTVEEIRNYILAQDSLGDVLHFLNADNIIKANKASDKCICDDPCEHEGKCLECGEKIEEEE